LKMESFKFNWINWMMSWRKRKNCCSHSFKARSQLSHLRSPQACPLKP
jgi:hypothetical protein